MSCSRLARLSSGVVSRRGSVATRPATRLRGSAGPNRLCRACENKGEDAGAGDVCIGV
jgi:hypothetical protein